jgi:enoyl-CoA hydratase/carnithine racemase
MISSASTTAAAAASGILLKETKGACVSLILNRPAQRNALSKDLLLCLRDELGKLETDGGRSFRVVLIRAASSLSVSGNNNNSIGENNKRKNINLASGNVFCSGHDLKEITSILKMKDLGVAQALSEEGRVKNSFEVKNEKEKERYQ